MHVRADWGQVELNSTHTLCLAIPNDHYRIPSRHDFQEELRLFSLLPSYVNSAIYTTISQIVKIVTSTSLHSSMRKLSDTPVYRVGGNLYS